MNLGQRKARYKKACVSRSFKSLFKPFQYHMWIWISVVLLVTPILFFIIAKIEFKTKGMSGYWAKLGNSAWYAFGTFFGEGITSSISSEPAWGIRYNFFSHKTENIFPLFLFGKKG